MGLRSAMLQVLRRSSRGLGLASSLFVLTVGAPAAAMELSETQVRAAIAGRRAMVQQSVDTAAGELTGKTVRLSGVVARTIHVVGDDFGQIAPLYIDLDPEGSGQPAPDVLYWAPVFAIMALEPGRRVSVTGIVQGFSVESGTDGRGLLLLQVSPLDRDHPDIQAQ